MTCEEQQWQVSELLDGALPDDAAGDLFGHLAVCRDCRVFHAAGLALGSAARRNEPAGFPAELDRRIAERLRVAFAAHGARPETLTERMKRVLATGIRVPATAAAGILLLAALLAGYAARTVLGPPPEARRTVVLFPTVEVAAYVNENTGM